MKNITCVVGTRPEAIKMAPVILELRKDKEFNVTALSTGQHTDMLIQALNDFGIVPDVNLNIMKKAQTLDYITSSVLQGVCEFLDAHEQDMILLFILFGGLPVIDTLTAFTRRMLTGKSPFYPDKKHLHHILMSLTGSTVVTVTILLMLQIMALSLGMRMYFRLT